MEDLPPTHRRTRDELRDLVTDWLDVLGLLAVAVGLVLGLWPYLGGFSLLSGGIAVLAGSAFAAWRAAPPPGAPIDGAVNARPARAASPRRRAPGPLRELIDALRAGARHAPPPALGPPGSEVA